MSRAAHDKLSEKDKEAFIQAAKRAAQATRSKIDELDGRGLSDLRQLGVEIVSDVDRAGFQRALAPLLDDWRRRFGVT
jgi:TRAP-type C4-dicarboxylate transport system substrate-binding protein